MRSKATVSSSRSASAAAVAASAWSMISWPSASGSSTSTCFCSEWIRSSLRSSGRQRLVGDLAQRHHRVLVVVAVDGDLRALRDQPGAVAGQQHQLEAVVDLVDAIFNGYAGHEVPLSCLDCLEIQARP